VNLVPFSAVEKMGSPHDLFKIVRRLYQRMAHPVWKCFFDEPISLLQRIRPWSKLPAKMGIRAA
jgi:hypothetical protein